MPRAPHRITSFFGHAPQREDTLFDAPVISVSELARSVRDLLERRFPLAWIAGEISNLTRAQSGHWYFTLKDAGSQVRCVMFRGRSQYLDWQPQEGMRVEVRALVTLYEPRGDFQLNVETMRRAGLGPLYERFLRLKDKLEREGLFDADAKRALPAFPRTVGIVTSLAAAALRDILTTLRRRNPSIGVIIYPVPVQGEGGAARIAAMLATASARNECDVLILARGGGSIEDLWQFNEESVARAIRAAGMPVVSGIGHETDFTIADFAADLRAPTPTGAAETVSPPRDALLARLVQLVERASRATARRIENEMQRVDALARHLVHPRERIAAHQRLLGQLSARLAAAGRRQLDSGGWRLQHAASRLFAARPDLAALERQRADLARRLGFATRQRLERARASLDRVGASLAGLDPSAVLGRGYSLTRNARGEVVRDAVQLTHGERLITLFARGWAESEVTRSASLEAAPRNGK